MPLVVSASSIRKSEIPWESQKSQGLSSFPSAPPLEFQSILPVETFAQLTAIHQNQSLTIPQKIAKIDAVMNELPRDILQRLPLPPIYRTLPKNIQALIKNIQLAENISIHEKWRKIKNIIQSLPEDQRRMFPQELFDFPPVL
ncbi:unnamed protein product [Thelazia callipaeda]|uniref:RNA-directed DNA polymerase n=1 Tax=Thelazia callipaeda TaxID=103827 RepID=A0A0N5CSI2_THECL|nr:unnamed protein product [Thelazia callipaeda]